jgi:hypothetical protein
MDYLPRPKDAVLPPIQLEIGDVEKYWSEASWSDYEAGVHWSSFPNRNGYTHGEWWDETSLWEDQVWTQDFVYWLTEMRHRPKEELRDLAIAWLYFGVLSEVSQCRLHLPRFWRITDGGQKILRMTSEDMQNLFHLWWINGRFLSGSFHARGDLNSLTLEAHPDISAEEQAVLTERPWKHKYDQRPFAKLDSQGRCISMERLGECLKKSKLILHLFVKQNLLDSETVFVICSLYETLGRMARYVFHGETIEKYEEQYRGCLTETAWASDAGYCQYFHESISTLGWCPRTANAFRLDTSRTLASDYFAINTKSPQSDEDHSACTIEMCLAYQLDWENYPKIHSDSDNCSCDNLLVDPEITGRVLADGVSFPLVQVSSREDGARDSGEATIEILDSASEHAYVAISHVWSHGLGNPQENSLPACQLLRIQSLVDKLGKTALDEHHADSSMPFWMDTLCVPREPQELRRKAIMRMRETYENAEHVLVIDKNLCALMSSDLTALEIISHMANSVWTTRLWTLQEGRLAKRLWFQFKDEALNLRKLLDEAVAAASERSFPLATYYADPTAPLRPLYTELVIFRASIAQRYIQDAAESRPPDSLNEDGNLYHQLQLIQGSLRGRSTSWASDEAICLCNLLGKDLAPILEYDTDHPEERMGAFWKQWRGISSGIIFNSFPRLTQEGLRWAPKTVLRHNQEGWLLHPNVRNGKELGQVSANGVLVKMAGLRLGFTQPWLKAHLAGGPGLGEMFVVMEADLDNNISGWYNVSVKEPVHTQAPDYDPDTHGSFAIIAGWSSMRAVSTAGCPALIVSIRRTIPGRNFVTSLCHVHLVRATDEEGLLYLQAYEARTIINMAYLEQQIEDWRAHAWITDAVDMVGERALAIPAVKSIFESTMGQNPENPIAEWWRAASSEMRQDFELRRTRGDIYWFREYHVNHSLRTVSPAVAFSDNQEWVVD